MKKTVPVLAAITVAILAFTSCGRRPVHHEYISTPVDGWEMIDTLTFHIDSLPATSDYRLSIGVRTATAPAYPFQALWLEVRQVWQPPTAMSRVDTVVCQLFTPQSGEAGSGVRLRDSTFPVPGTVRLKAGSAGTISVRHIMRSDILPGVADVGIRLDRE